jgi:lysophospholipase L1-like esterase
MRGALAACLLCAALATAVPAALPPALPPALATPLASVPIERAEPWWRQRFQDKLREARTQDFQLVFLGDSITQRWESPDYRVTWQRYYDDRRALNLGFSGDATSHLLWRIDHGELDGLHPRVAVILIGTNNLGRLRWPVPDDVAGIAAVVRAVQARLPGTKILLLGVPPSDRNDWALPMSQQINRALAARYGAGAVPGVTFLDLSSLFMLPGGQVNDALFAEAQRHPPEPALHPSPEGMARLAAAMEPTLSALLGDTQH